MPSVESTFTKVVSAVVPFGSVIFGSTKEILVSEITVAVTILVLTGAAAAAPIELAAKTAVEVLS